MALINNGFIVGIDIGTEQQGHLDDDAHQEQQNAKSYEGLQKLLHTLRIGNR